MKKILIYLAFMLVATLSSFSQIKVEIGTVKAMPNSNVQVPITLSENPNGLLTDVGQMYIDYDDSQLEPLSISGFNSAIPENKWLINLNLGCPNVRLCPIAVNWLDCDQVLPAGSTFFVINFRYKGSSDAYVRWSTNMKEPLIFDKDGTNEIQTQWIDGKVSPTVKYDVSLYPNPLVEGNIVYLNAKFDLPSLTTVKLIDMNGKVLKEESIEGARILYNYPFDLNKLTNESQANLVNGAYIILIENMFGSMPLKFTIAK